MTLADAETSAFHRARVTIDDEHVFEAWFPDGDEPGIAQPYFEEATMRAVVRHFGMHANHEPPLQTTLAVEGDVVLLHDGDSPSAPRRLAPVVIQTPDGPRRIWPIGAGEWIWDEATDP